MSTRTRSLLAGLLSFLVAVSLYRYFTREPSATTLLNMVGGIILWTFPKGALIRFMAGRRYYQSALLANAASEISSLGFPLSPLGVPWPALGASMVLSTIIEAVALMVMGTARAPACLIISLYMNFFAHVFLVGWFLWPNYHLAGGGIIFLSFLIFILPIFIVDRPV